MSKATMDDVWAPILAEQKARVMEMTWGHLSPKKNKTYRGFIVFAIGGYGDDPLNPTVLQCSFKGLSDSPWFFEHMQEFLQGLQDVNHEEFWGPGEYKLPIGGVYRFDGTFRNYEFKGEVARILAPEQE